MDPDMQRPLEEKSHRAEVAEKPDLGTDCIKDQ